MNRGEIIAAVIALLGAGLAYLLERQRLQNRRLRRRLRSEDPLLTIEGTPLKIWQELKKLKP